MPAPHHGPGDGGRPWYVNEDGHRWRSEPKPDGPWSFHRSLDGYRPTPLIDLPDLAAELGVDRLMIKDESDRLGLPAFKILGASWAICRAIGARIGLDPAGLTLDGLRARLGPAPSLTLVTATDGNHGRAVARMARLLGVAARIYTAAGVSDPALDGIRSEGADLIVESQPYDAVVMTAAASTADRPSELLIQDTSWEGYREIPTWIVDGYTTMLAEMDDQLGLDGPRLSHVVVPMGVGSLAQAVLQHYRSGSAIRPRVIGVEPTTAAGITRSLLAGHVTSVHTTETIMAGLNCGTPSQAAWPWLSGGLDAAVAVTDPEVLEAVRDLHLAGVGAGPCAAAALAALRVIVAEGGADQTSLGPNAHVVLIGTEGIDANPVDWQSFPTRRAADNG